MLEVNNKLCTGCGACVSACPVKCISLKESKEGFLFPQADGARCIDCDICNKICPLEKQYSCKNESYSVVNKSDIPEKSSSTGLAYSLAKKITAEGGLVFGAAFDDSFGVVHRGVSKEEELSLLQGSKYVQSDTANTFSEIKTALSDGRTVLFIGTPCQVAGLKSYVGSENDNLYTIDFICHGVPSPKVWRYYLDYIKKSKNTGDIKDVNFRDSKYGWANYGISITGNQNSYFAFKSEDLYQKAFSRDITLRKACCYCKFKGDNRYSDITVGDFWGGDKYCGNYSDKGTSAVIVHTDKGFELFENAQEQFVCEKTDFAEYFKSRNKAMMKAARPNRTRDRFFEEFALSPSSVAQLLAKYIKKRNLSLKVLQIKGKIKRGIRRLIHK